MAIFDDLKSVGRVLQEAGKIEQYQQILDTLQKLLEMQKRIDELEWINKNLLERLEVKENLFPENNMYWFDKDGRKDGPFCTQCWDSEQKLVRLHKGITHQGIQCPKCKIWTVNPMAQQFRPTHSRRNPAI